LGARALRAGGPPPPPGVSARRRPGGARDTNAPGSISVGTNSRMSGYQQHCGYQSTGRNGYNKNAEPKFCPEPRPDRGKRFAHCANLIVAEVSSNVCIPGAASHR